MICNEEDTDGRAMVTTDEERVLPTLGGHSQAQMRLISYQCQCGTPATIMSAECSMARHNKLINNKQKFKSEYPGINS